MLLPKRIWKDIPGYEGLYQVSNDGKVRSLDRVTIDKIGRKRPQKGAILKPGIRTGGYKKVGLCKNGVIKHISVHRLVALAFIPNPNNLPCINHINEVRTDNRAENLEWCTVEYNCNYGAHNKKLSEACKGKPGLKGGANGMAKPVLMFTKEGVFIRRFDSVVDANEYLGKDRYNANINMCATGNSKTAWGYKWKYE